MTKEKTVLDIKIPYRVGCVELDVKCPKCRKTKLYFDPDKLEIYCIQNDCDYNKTVALFLYNWERVPLFESLEKYTTSPLVCEGYSYLISKGWTPERIKIESLKILNSLTSGIDSETSAIIRIWQNEVRVDKNDKDKL